MNCELQIGGAARCAILGCTSGTSWRLVLLQGVFLAFSPSASETHRMPARPPAPLPGIRTGYCGSLTTFASWNLELLTLAVAQAKVRAEPKRAAGGMCGRSFPAL